MLFSCISPFPDPVKKFPHPGLQLISFVFPHFPWDTVTAHGLSFRPLDILSLSSFSFVLVSHLYSSSFSPPCLLLFLVFSLINQRNNSSIFLSLFLYLLSFFFSSLLIASQTLPSIYFFYFSFLPFIFPFLFRHRALYTSSFFLILFFFYLFFLYLLHFFLSSLFVS